MISDVLINYSPIGSIADQFYGLKVFLSWWLDGSPFSLMKSPEFYNYNSKLKTKKTGNLFPVSVHACFFVTSAESSVSGVCGPSLS